MQTDIIYYGDDLLGDIANEFDVPPRHPAINPDPPRIPFWSDLVLGTESENF